MTAVGLCLETARRPVFPRRPAVRRRVPRGQRVAHPAGARRRRPHRPAGATRLRLRRTRPEAEGRGVVRRVAARTAPVGRRRAVPRPVAVPVARDGIGRGARCEPARPGDGPHRQEGHGWGPPLRPLKEGGAARVGETSSAPLWLDGTAATDPATGFINAAGLAAFLGNETPPDDSLTRPDDLYGFEPPHRDRHRRRPVRRRRRRDLRHQLPVGEAGGTGSTPSAELPGGAADLAGVHFLAFGGEGKRVRLRTVARSRSRPPPRPATKSGSCSSRRRASRTRPGCRLRSRTASPRR